MVTIKQEESGQRIDNFLFRHLKHCPKSRVYKAIRSGEVRVNSKRVKPLYKIKAQDIIRIPLLAKPKESVIKTMELPKFLSEAILYEDESLLVINKPVGLAVHAGTNEPNGLIEILRNSTGLPASIDLVHRLDKATSGVVILAKTRSSMLHLHQQFNAKSIKKIYLALVLGKVSQNVGVMENFLAPHMVGGVHRMKCGSQGKLAQTAFKVEKRYWIKYGSVSNMDEYYTLVKLMPKTGRKHQIRVQCEFIGHPIVKDQKYFDLKYNFYQSHRNISFFLHALETKFVHPVTQQLMLIKAPLTMEKKQCLDWLNHIS